jgi:hypothetical protein
MNCILALDHGYDRHTDLSNTKSRMIVYFTISESPLVRCNGSDKALITRARMQYNLMKNHPSSKCGEALTLFVG